MIRAIIGLQGAGKTYFTMWCLERELVQSKRWCVTTLTEIKVPEFQVYLSKKYPDQGIDLANRLQIIPKTEARFWYRYRGHYTLPPLEDRGKTELPEAFDHRCEAYFRQINERDSSGVVYFLDEAHRWAGARDWADYSHIAIFYLAQHRHLNDTFWWVTQNSEQVIPTLRRQTQDCHLIRNHYVESFSIFQKPGCFFRESFGFVPETKARGTAEPYDTGKLHLDVKGLGNCYQTRGALGGEITVAEDKPKTKKLPFWTIYAAVAVFFVLLALGFLYGPGIISGGVTSILTGSKVLPGKPVPGQDQAKPASPGAVLGNALSLGPSPGPGAHVVQEPKELPLVRGVAVRGRAFRVTLTDGRVLTDADRMVTGIDDRGVHLTTGEILRYVQVSSASRAASFQVAKPAPGSSGAPIGGTERGGASAGRLVTSAAVRESPRAVRE